jgi:stage V sporulation protein G
MGAEFHQQECFMNITEIRTKLVNDASERLRAYCSITIDGDFVIRDLKIIDGPNGPFLAMPSRKLADRCPKCGAKNHLRARFCNECGVRLPENRAPKDGMGRSKLHADVAHPINAACRERIQQAVVEAFLEEIDASHQPGYKPVEYDEYDEEQEEDAVEAPAPVDEVESEEEEPAVADFDDGGFGAGVDEIPSSGRRRSSRDDAPTTDYDSLIADLKRDAAGRRTDGDRGRDRRGDRRSDRGTERGTERVADRPEPVRQPTRTEGGGPPRGESDRGRQSGPRGRRDEKPDTGRDRDRRESHAPQPQPQPRVAEAPKPAPKPVAPPPPPPKPAPAQDDSDSDFGAGIL